MMSRRERRMMNINFCAVSVIPTRPHSLFRSNLFSSLPFCFFFLWFFSFRSANLSLTVLFGSAPHRHSLLRFFSFVLLFFSLLFHQIGESQLSFSSSSSPDTLSPTLLFFWGLPIIIVLSQFVLNSRRNSLLRVSGNERLWREEWRERETSLHEGKERGRMREWKRMRQTEPCSLPGLSFAVAFCAWLSACRWKEKNNKQEIHSTRWVLFRFGVFNAFLFMS